MRETELLAFACGGAFTAAFMLHALAFVKLMDGDTKRGIALLVVSALSLLNSFYMAHRIHIRHEAEA